MKISIIHPTRRGNTALFVANEWLYRASMKIEIEYILSVDSDDPEHYDVSSIFEYPDFKMVRNLNRSAIDAINNAAKIATGDLLIVVSDDFKCQHHWDTKLINSIRGRTDFLAKTGDGLQPTLVTLPIMDHKYYERFGYIYQPDYLHMFCDQEMTAVAHMIGKIIELPMLFEHLHPSTGKTKKDALNERNDQTWRQGEQLFNERLKTNFGLKDSEIVKPYSEIKWH